MSKTEEKGIKAWIAILFVVIALLVGGFTGGAIADDTVSVTKLEIEKGVLVSDNADLDKEVVSLIEKLRIKPKEIIKTIEVEVVKEVEIDKEVEVLVDNPETEAKLDLVVDWLKLMDIEVESVDDMSQDIDMVKLAKELVVDELVDNDDFDRDGFRSREIEVVKLRHVELSVLDRDDNEFEVSIEAEVKFEDDDNKKIEFIDVIVFLFEDIDDQSDWAIEIDE